MSKKYDILIKVDTNDADYITEVNTITEEVLNKIKPLIKAIKKNEGHNFDVGEYSDEETQPRNLYPQFSEELIELFMGLCPYGENGFHTIETVEIWETPVKQRLI